MTTNFIGVLLPNSPDYTVNTGFSTELYDAEGGQTIIVQAGASLELLGALGANTINLAGAASDWQVYRDGSNMIAVRADGSRVEVPANTTTQTIAFSDVSLGLRIAVNGSTPAVMLGNQTLDTAAAPVGGVPPAGSTQQAPWTLIMPASGGIYGSDGSAAGSKFLVAAESFTGRMTVANASQTAAIVAGTSLYGTDGTAAGTAVIGAVSLGSDQTIYKFGNKIVISDSGSSYYQGVVTDGTKAGTVVLADLPAELVDPVTQTLWGGLATGPYGREMFRTVVTDTGASTTMVKDIQPGSGSAVFYSSSGAIALLPNGRVVFAADDGAGSEPWVSDGTAAGTVKLADLNSSHGSYPSGFTTVGDKVAFVADVSGAGRELVFTDGTPDGTRVFDITPGATSSAPAVLGVIDGILYFTVEIYGANYSTTKSIYSSDGSSFHEVAKVGTGSVLLGWGGDKAFLKSTDAAHGQELWVMDLVDGSTQLVKDILAGTGSALADTSSLDAFMLGSRLAFSAYTSPTDRAFFLSDGTAAGTWQIGKEAPRQTITLGQNIFFTDSDGVHVVDSSGHVSLLGAASGVPYYQQIPMQADRDQVYFVDSAKALYSANGSTAALLAAGISQFKVVGENGVFFIKSMADSAQGLWFSDGTSAGTRFVQSLPNGNYDLGDAAGLHTAGMPLPADSFAPQLASAKVNGNKLTLIYNDDSPLDASHPPAAGAFHLSGTTATVASVAVDVAAHSVVLTLSADVKSTDKVLLSYTDPTAGNDAAAIQDSFGNDAASVTGWFTVNVTPDNVAPVLASASVNGATLTLTYTEAGGLDGSHLPPLTSFKLDGTTATITGISTGASGNELVLTLSQPVLSTDAVKLGYTDPTTGNDAAAVQDIAGNDAASVAGVSVDNKTLPVHGQAPWTLLVGGNSGVFSSDGTSAGSKYVYTQPQQNYWYGKQLVANGDHSAAVFFTSYYNSTTKLTDHVAIGIDGSGSAPVVLASDIADFMTAFVLGKNIVLPDGGDTTYSGMVTDGTAAGSHKVDNLMQGVVDVAHQYIWSPTISEPYGMELSLTHIGATATTTGMVKDIWPGSSSGYLGGVYDPAVVLANGKLVFAGSDGASGTEPWVSDGTDAGTVRLADLYGGSNGSTPQNFVSFGSLAAFSAVVSDNAAFHGRELVVTDGTVAGTHVFDINPADWSSMPQPVGSIGGTLYFTADVTSGDTTTRAMYSTDGSSIVRLADVNGNVSMLGQAGGKIFVSISDSVHGAELWAGDATGAFGMVKDILPGSGSALSGSINPIVVGSRLVFQAYTSASTQSLFVSDGTATGTVQLGAAVNRSEHAGNVLVYGDGGKVYGLDVAAATPAPVALATGDLGTTKMQADADQVFFAMANGDLYASNGSVAGTVALAHGVKAFKVVGENALYIIEQVSGGTGYGLNYSDGSADGTYFIGYVDADLANNFDNAIGIKTVGVPPPQH
jgi:uncharacterized repeat protein (TIGR02059 family)